MLKRIKLYYRLIFLSLILAFGFTALAQAQAVVQSYNASSPLQPGIIAQLVPGSSNTVQALQQTSAKKMFGLVINPNDTTVALSAPSSKQVFVATGGTYPVLVSSQNGSIAIGDYVTISSLDGIGMKATSNDSIVLGRATSAFSGSTDSLGTAQLKGNSKTTTVQLGRVNVSINVAKNPLQITEKNDLPSFLRSAGQTITSKPISAARAYVALVVIVISAVIAGSLLYGGVKSSIISIGRNPLSKKSIVRGLIQITLTSLIVFIAGLFAVYLLLKY